MKVFSKVVDEETKLLDCIACGDVPPEGYSELEREQGYDGNWYIAGYASEPSIDYQNEQIRKERQARFESESDPIRYDYDEALARGEDTAEALKQEWLASKDKIREELPYIIGETNDKE